MKKLFVVAGPAASGKSTFANQLSKKLEVTWLDFDDNIDELIASNKALIDEIGTEAFLSKFRQGRYDDLISRAKKVLDVEDSLVISAPFTIEVSSQAAWDQRFTEILKAGIKPILYWVATDPKIREERMAKRGADRDREKSSGYKFEAQDPVVKHFRIDGALDFSEALAEIPQQGI